MSELVIAPELRPEEKTWSWILNGILPLLAVVVLLASCILDSAEKEIWIDEVFQ